MSQAAGALYARFRGCPQGDTFCNECRLYLPDGRDGEFVWDGTDERLGT
jgi:hypothetical protein